MRAALAPIEAAPDYVEQACRALVDAIATGRLAPGERLTQEDLARRLNVSRQPVLQALRLLKNDGLVEDAPGRGLQVAPLDEQVIARVYEVRGALDRLAARLAAACRMPVDPQLLAEGRRAVAAHDIQAMIEADIAFHRGIYAASGNPLIEQAAQRYWAQVRRAMGSVLRRSEGRDTVWDEHEAIARAIAAGDADEADRLMTAHTAWAGRHMCSRLQQARPGAAAPHP
ncbi:MAG: GntR family transcriptional regulator [Rubrivivax sp.]|nr:GntR family transcriptional regulator [Rubrivivax sp.]